MRVTFSALNRGLDAINTAAEQFIEAQHQVSTGKRLRQLSTDPAASQRVVVERAELANIDSYKQAGSAASSRLAALDQKLSNVVDQIILAQVAAASGRSSNASATTRAAAAMTLQGLRASVQGDINTQSDGVYLFAGSATDQPAYVDNGSGWVYQGDSAAVSTEVQSGRRVTLTLDGQSILQGSDSTDLLTTLDDLATAVQNGDSAAIDSGMAALDRALKRVSRALSLVGTDEVSVEDSTRDLSTRHLASEKRISDLENANLAEAITDMSRAQTAYSAALGAVGTASRNSLLDYIT